eukprot:TRINITY_DN26810_c0_g1_i1.p1 TRINITY_DN26810_c0_g1~~TRINITY_DN26810_c0_g1_i1.p1  ORF type:complete len:490 (+),score=103.91 TRINITY_DN26810_c0_g1_i1:80-1549(+)
MSPAPSALAKRQPNGVVAAAAAAVLLSRIGDARHLSRLVLQDGSLKESFRILVSAGAIFGYERAMFRLLKKVGLDRIPSTLAAMLSLFGVLRSIQKLSDRETSDRIANMLKPGVDWLGKWMGLFLAPPLVSLDASIAALPPYGRGVWVNTCALVASGWTATHMLAGAIATKLLPVRGDSSNGTNGQHKPAAAATPKTSAVATKDAVISQEEATRRAWIFLGALGYLGVSLTPLLPPALHKPLGMVCELSTTVGSFSLARLLPDAAQRVLHPIVVCATCSNLAARFVGPVAPYFDNGSGVGDYLFRLLPAAMTGLGLRMYSTTALWLDDPGDFKCVLTTCTASGCFSLLGTAVIAGSSMSPLQVPAPLSLPLCCRSVMSALGIEGAKAIGPEADPKLAVASILITGCIGASMGKTLLECFPALFDSKSPLVTGVSMGCSAHSIGTAGLIADGDTQAAAISGASMCLAGTVHTLVLQLPGVVPWIRAMARV